jgi:antitoxin ParD1/3/4
MSTTLTLPSDLADKVQAHIDAGAGADPVEVLRASLDALEAAEAGKLQAIRAKIDRALADPRPSVPADEAFGRVGALIDALASR